MLKMLKILEKFFSDMISNANLRMHLCGHLKRGVLGKDSL